MSINTALLVMDMQSGILRNYPAGAAASVAKAIAKARASQIPVIYIVLGFREGMPEINPDNKMFSSIRERFSGISPEEFSRIDAPITPQTGDIIVTKKRVSAFSGSDLEIVLRSQHIRHLVLTGIATSGVVLSTLREAADKDFRLTVLSDCCFDGDEEVHRVLTTKVFTRQANVITVKEWETAL